MDVVRHHDDGLVEFVDCSAQKAKNFLGGVRIEVTGRFVCDDDCGAAHECAGNGDALLLATRELGGPVTEALFQSERGNDEPEPVLVNFLSGEL